MLGRPQQPGKRNDLESAITTMRVGGLQAVAEEHGATVCIFPEIHYSQHWGKLNYEEKQLEYNAYCIMFPWE